MASLSYSEAERPVEPDPRPLKRVRAGPKEWERIRAGFEGQPCVSCGAPHQSLHHATPKSQGGDDVIPNLVPLCGDGTRGCHGTLENHSAGWEKVAQAVRTYVCTDPERWAYVLDKLGEGRFDRRYPSLLKVCERRPWCASFAGHNGECLPLSDEAYQPRGFSGSEIGADFENRAGG